MSFTLQRIVKSSIISSKPFSRGFHCSTVCCGKKWREERKLPSNPNSFGPLTNLPDYSFADNRPVPYGTNQKRRIDTQRQHLIQIKKLVGQIDSAVERYDRLQRQKAEEEQRILNSKLKEKGVKLLSKES